MKQNKAAVCCQCILMFSHLLIVIHFSSIISHGSPVINKHLDLVVHVKTTCQYTRDVNVRSKMYWNLTWNSPGFVPFGTNLAHFGANFEIREVYEHREECLVECVSPCSPVAVTTDTVTHCQIYHFCTMENWRYQTHGLCLTLRD